MPVRRHRRLEGECARVFVVGALLLLTARKGRLERGYLYIKHMYYLIIPPGNWLEAA